MLDRTLGAIDRMPLLIALIAALTLGLAPFVPEPHLWEKLRMLATGTLTRPIDIFDLILHGAPWLLLGVKLARMGLGHGGGAGPGPGQWGASRERAAATPVRLQRGFRDLQRHGRHRPQALLARHLSVQPVRHHPRRLPGARGLEVLHRRARGGLRVPPSRPVPRLAFPAATTRCPRSSSSSTASLTSVSARTHLPPAPTSTPSRTGSAPPVARPETRPQTRPEGGLRYA